MRLSSDDDQTGKKRLEEGSDPELGLVYYLFAKHGILPGDYYRRSEGEKDLIWALSSYEADGIRAVTRVAQEQAQGQPSAKSRKTKKARR